MTRSRLVWLAALVALAGCPERRKPIPVKKDGGPAVVVIDKKPVSGGVDLGGVGFDDEKEPNDKREAAQPIPSGRGVRGALEAPAADAKAKLDEDWYSLMVTAGGEGAVELVVEARSDELAPPVVEMYDGNGARIWQAAGAGVGEAQRIPNLGIVLGQTYYVKVRRAESKVKPTAALPYTLVTATRAAQPPCETEPNDSKDTANVLDENVDLAARWSKVRDEDWYKVKGGAADAWLKVEVSAVPKVAPALNLFTTDAKTPVSQIRGVRGEELRIRNLPLGKGVDALLALRAIEGRNEEATYVLRVSTEAALDGGEKEPNDTLQTAEALTLPEVGGGPVTVSGFLWMGDIDTYRVVGPDEALYRVELDVPSRTDLRIERVAPTTPAGATTTKVDAGGAGKGEVMDKEAVATTPVFRVRGRPKDVLFDEPYTLRLTRVQ